MIQEIVLDNSFVRLAMLVTLPFLYCISLVRRLHHVTTLSRS